MLRISSFIALALAPAASGLQEPKEDGRIFAAADGSLSVHVRDETIGYQEPGMSIDSMQIADDGKSVAYMLMMGDSLTVVHNGVRGEPFDAISSETLRFSPDSSRLTYAGVRGSQAYAVVDGQAYPCSLLTGKTLSPRQATSGRR